MMAEANARSLRRFAELEMKVLSMNLSGRFAARELKIYGQRALQYLLEKENVALLFGHLAGFKMSPMENYEYIGTNKAFFLFNTDVLRGGDDKQFKQLVRNLQFRGKLSHNYVQENSFAVCKFRARHDPLLQFIAISWPSDECDSRLKIKNNFKHMIRFAADLAYLEQLPIVIGGTATSIPTDLVSSMHHDFEFYGYKYANARRAARASEFYVLSSGSIRLTEVKPVICGKIDLNKDSHIWKTPEDFFYYDPVKAVLWLEKIKSWGSSLSLLSSTATDIPAEPTLDSTFRFGRSQTDSSVRFGRSQSYENHHIGYRENRHAYHFEEDQLDTSNLNLKRSGSYVISKDEDETNVIYEDVENDTHFPEPEIKSQIEIDDVIDSEIDVQNCIEGGPPLDVQNDEVCVDSSGLGLSLDSEKKSRTSSDLSNDIDLEQTLSDMVITNNVVANNIAAPQEMSALESPSSGRSTDDNADFEDDLQYDWHSTTALCSVS